jgi:hypothetical protein
MSTLSKLGWDLDLLLFASETYRILLCSFPALQGSVCLGARAKKVLSFDLPSKGEVAARLPLQSLCPLRGNQGSLIKTGIKLSCQIKSTPSL